MLLIKNSRVMDPETGLDETLDLLVDDGRIIALKKDIPADDLDEDTLLIDGTGLIAAPGLVDVHVHFRDPGLTQKEDIETGARAAIAGGFTTVVCMANTKPVADNADTIKYVYEKADKTGIWIYQASSITKGMKGEELVDFEALCDLDVPGFTDDGVPILDAALCERAMELSAKYNVPLSFHEENPEYIENNGVNHGKASEYYKIGGSDRMAEVSMIERDVALAKKTGAIINIQHISTKEGVELVRNAVAGDTERKIHAEAAPHHFTLNEEACIKYGTLAKMNPPLREEADRLAIIEGLKDGTIDIIATDHAPHTKEEKEKPITEAPSGIIGLETSLALGITELVKPGHLTMMQLLEKMSLNPARLYGFAAGRIAVGGPADIILIDENEEWTVPDSFESKAVNTPFVGQKLIGRVKCTICDGVILM